MVIVESYCWQIINRKIVTNSVKEIGCRVKLSDWGLQMQGKGKKKLIGTVVEFDQWMHYENDGTITVKWDGIAKPSSMHISQVEIIKQK